MPGLAPDAQYRVSASALRLRAQPDGTAPVLGVLARDQAVTRLTGDSAAEWWNITTKVAGETLNGFVAAKYLEPQAPAFRLVVDHGRLLEACDGAFGPLVAASREGLAFIVEQIESDTYWLCLEQVAYLLATIKWETGHTFRPVYEKGSRAYFERYAGKLGNNLTDDPFKYRGRGYVQITGRSNYRYAGDQMNAPLENDPDLALEPDIAYQGAARGIRGGWFGRPLKQFVRPGVRADYVEARRSINGREIETAPARVESIADIARRFEDCLRRVA